MFFPGIEAFLAIVENGSISKAAEILTLSQSSVSYRLKTLENELGFKLIVRNKGVLGIELTSQGYSFLNAAEKTLALRYEVERIRNEDSQTPLTIGTADSISLYLMPGLYRSILESFNNIRPFILTQHTMETYNSIKNKEIDIGFVKRDFAMPNVMIKKIIDEEMVLVRFGSPEKYLAPINPKELKERDEIFMDWGYAYQIWHDYWWKPDQYAIRVDAADLIFELFTAEHHWAVVPRSIFRALSGRGTFCEQHLTDRPPNRVCHMIRHKYCDKAKEQIFDHIEAYFTASCDNS